MRTASTWGDEIGNDKVHIYIKDRYVVVKKPASEKTARAAIHSLLRKFDMNGFEVLKNFRKNEFPDKWEFDLLLPGFDRLTEDGVQKGGRYGV